MDNIELIDNYLAGELNDDESKAFKELCDSNPEIKQEVEFHSEINQSILEDDIQELRALLLKTYEYTFKGNIEGHRQKHNQIRLRNLLAVAASIIFILLAIQIKQKYFISYSGDIIFQQFYNTYKSDLVYRSVDMHEDLFSMAIKQYDSGQYETAINTFGEVIKKEPNNYMALYYYALTCMELGSYKDALIQFESALEHTNRAYDEHIKWYMALCYLQLGKNNLAKILLHSLKANEKYYAKRAGKILRLL